MRNIVLEKSYREYAEEASPTPFSKKIKTDHHLCIKSLWTYIISFHCMSKLRTMEIY